jgi:hypothetical protein
MKQRKSVSMIIDDAFRFQDGSIVVVGNLDHGDLPFNWKGDVAVAYNNMEEKVTLKSEMVPKFTEESHKKLRCFQILCSATPEQLHGAKIIFKSIC